MANNFMKAMLIHIGTNLWYEKGNERGGGGEVWKCPASDDMRFDINLFREYTEHCRECGINTLVLDLADGIVYESHPEIAINGSLTRAELVRELDRLWGMGFEVIPKLNFSTCHDYWLKDYARMVSTKTYYDVCRDIIEEVCEVFKPKYLHIGYDEEDYAIQSKFDLVTIRQNDLWWHDLYFFVDCIERCGVRACMWSDYARTKPEEFVAKCPKSVLQCSWYYWTTFDNEDDEDIRKRLIPFRALAEHGFDQFPGGSNCSYPDNFGLLTDFCKKTIHEDNLYGMMMTTWLQVTEEWREQLFAAADIVKETFKD